MSEEKILAGSATGNNTSGMVIAGETGSATPVSQPNTGVTTLQERLSASTTTGGLTQLPGDYDASEGDWRLILSNNPFEVLYLDYRLFKLIQPDMVTANYALLEKFWKDKVVMMNTGGTRIAFKAKYGEGTIDNSLIKLKRAFEKLNSVEGIEQYFIEINTERIKKGEADLKDSIEHMMMDGCADKAEIQLCITRGLKYDLNAEETAVIIKNNLDTGQFKPYGTVSGNTLLDQLQSVEHWMTQPKIEEAELIKKERELLRIQILPNKYATTIEEIGSILFEDPDEAKEIIREDLLKQVIAQKDIVLARDIGSLSKGSNLDAAFLSIVYKLNRTLPFAFSSQKRAKTLQELCTMAFETEQSLKQGKEHLKKGYIEIWLRETDAGAYKKFIDIRDNAENIDLAFLEFLYIFNPSLPYRFSSNSLVNTPEELCTVINQNKETWESGKKELFDSWIVIWLATTQHNDIALAWNKVKGQFTGRQDVGLEFFLHLLNKQLIHSRLSTTQISIDYPKIQSGRIVTTEVRFLNETRGCAEAVLKFTKPIPGVTLSAENFLINNVTGTSQCTISLHINTAVLVKGVHYETGIQVVTSEQQQIEIPVSFKIVFPKNAFWLEVIKYAVIMAAFFVLIRLVLSSSYPDWLSNSFYYFIGWEEMMNNLRQYSLFGWTFFLFIGLLSAGIYSLIKFLYKK